MNEQVLRVAKHPAAIPSAVGLAGLGLGVVTGYVIGFKRGEGRAWDRIIAEMSESIKDQPVDADEDVAPRVVLDADQLEDMRERWAEQATPPEEVVSERVLTPEEVRHAGYPVRGPESEAEPYPQAILDAAEEAGVTPEQIVRDMERVKAALEREDSEVDEPETEETNVFANTGEGWDYDAELAAREGQTIFVIHADEYVENAEDYTHVTLTYYEGDDLMADEEEQLVTNYQRVVGELNFGHGSGDPNVVYVRNLEREVEYEILRHHGYFTKEVEGLDMDSERARTRPRRMRESDDGET